MFLGSSGVKSKGLKARQILYTGGLYIMLQYVYYYIDDP